jgi:class 3 adenylate cyclase/tetratricopeptide (TPR) repeat protein
MTGASGLDRESSEAPRRVTATILFSDLCHSTRIAGSLEAEDYGDLLWRLQTIFHRVIGRHEGQIAQISADGMLAAFGHPEPRENDARRAVEAALDLRDEVSAIGGEERWRVVAPRLHSGIHTGDVLFISGDEVRGRFELLGRPTNIASRLCGEAGPDQILVSAETLGPERYLFETTAPFPLRLRGWEEPLSTLAVTGRAPINSRYAASERAGLTPFVGREAELRLLLEGLDRVRAGDSLSLDVRAPAGEGKTRLAEEFLREAIKRDWTVHRGECEATGEPLQPFLQIARSIFGIGPLLSANAAIQLLDHGLATIGDGLSADRPVWLRLLSLQGEEVGPAAAAAALRAVLAGLCSRHPVILFIDDWHAADNASRAMRDALCGLEALFILTTSRPSPEGDLPLGAGALLRLSPFTEREVEQVVGQLLPAADPFLVSAITASSGGNPLFIEELCHSAASGQQEGRPKGGSPWLNILIRSRFSRLPEAQADLVRVAAIIGTIIPAWLFELRTGCTENDPVLATLAEEDFLFPGERPGTLRFKHGITRDAIYNAIGLHERRALHLLIAEAIRTRGSEWGEVEPFEALAYHYERGGDAVETARYAELAGDKAMAVSALDRAQANYRAALAALDDLPGSEDIAQRWGDIAQRFGRAAVFDPSRDQLPVFERAIKRARLRGDSSGLTWAHYWLGYINYALGEPGAAIGHCEQALAAAPPTIDNRLPVQIRATLGQAKAAACDYPGALALLDEAIEIKRRHRTGARTSTGFAYSLSCRAFALGDMAEFEAAHACFAEAMELVGGTDHEVEASVLNHHAAVNLWQHRFEEALRLADGAARIAERVRSHYAHAMSRSIRAFARWRIDADPTALPILMEGIAGLEASGRGQYTSLNYGWLAEVLVASGRIDEARHHAAGALWRAHKHDHLGAAMAMRAIARAADGARRTRYLDRAMTTARIRCSPHEAAATELLRASLAPPGCASARTDMLRARARLAELGMDSRAWQAAESRSA